MLISVQSEDYGTHTWFVAVIAPNWLGTEVFVDEVNRVDFMQVEHVVEQLGGVLELVVTKRTNCSFDDVKRIRDDVPVELVLSLGVNQRFVIRPRQAGQPGLHLVGELLQPGVEVERLLVDQTVDLTEPLDQALDPGDAVVPPGDPLVEEHHHVDGVALGGDGALGHSAGELEVFVQEDRLQLGVGQPGGLGGELTDI